MRFDLLRLAILVLMGAAATGGTLACGSSSGPAVASGGANGSGGAVASGGRSGSGGGGVGNGGSGSGGRATGGDGGRGGATPVTGGAGGTPGSAGSAGGSPGGGPGAGPCTAVGIVTCDDFETGILQWVKHPMAMTAVAIDNTRGHESTSSIKVTSANAPFGHISTPPGAIPTSKDFYVRVWAYFGKSTAQIMGHVAYIVGATAEDNSGIEVRFGSSSTFSSAPMAMLDLNFIGSGAEFSQFSNGDITGGNPSTTPGKALQANEWYCLEAFYKGSTSEFQAWVDETEVTALHVTDFGGRRANWAPAYTLVKVGAQDFSGSIGTVWYDDVAMGTQRIHCNHQ